MLPKWTYPVLMLVIFCVACTPFGQPDAGNDDPGNALYRDSNEGFRFVANEDDKNAGNDRADLKRNTNRVGFGQNELGFSHYSPDNMRTPDGQQEQIPEIQVDRNVLAQQISYLVTASPQIKEATVLVTDDHVFVGIDDMDGQELDEQNVNWVRQNALSVTPRYYDIHVTDDDDLKKNITQLGNQLSDGGNLADYRDDLNELLQKMGDDTPVRGNTGPLPKFH